MLFKVSYNFVSCSIIMLLTSFPLELMMLACTNRSRECFSYFLHLKGQMAKQLTGNNKEKKIC
jgi:hypothetical protein